MARTTTLALCIPAYNAARFLPRLLHSANAQTVPFDEILLYDDCSTDNTGQVARSFGACVITGSHNVGCSAGKNRLLEATRCDWIHFHDADDDLKPEFSEVAREWMERHDVADVVLFSYENRKYENEATMVLRTFDDFALVHDAAGYAVREQINPYCGLYRRTALLRVGGYDEDPAVLYNEDCRFHMRLAFAGLRFRAEQRCLVINLERSDSMSSANREKCALARLAVLEKAAREAPQGLHCDIAQQAWLVARHLAAYRLHSQMVDAIRLAQRLGLSVPPTERTALRVAARVSPVTAFKARAAFVRWRDGRSR